MAESEIRKILKIEGIETVKQLRDYIKSLQDELVKADTNTSKYQETTQKLLLAQEKLGEVTSAGKKTMDGAKDSIVGMEKEYKNLYNAYKLLTDEQRKSDYGKNMAASLKQLSEQLNETKKNVGNFKDNIGHYSQDIVNAFGQMGVSVGGLAAPLNSIIGISQGLKNLEKFSKEADAGLKGMGGAMGVASKGVKTLGASLKALIANPVGATIMAIVIAFKALTAIAGKVKEAINGNEEASDRLREAMSAFQPIINGVNNAFTALGNAVVWVIEKISDAWSWIDRVFTRAGAERQKVYKEEAKLQTKLKQDRREAQKQNSIDEEQVATLRNEAAALTDVAEKKKKLNEAIEAQMRINQRNNTIAQEELQILQNQASHTANNAEMNDKLAAAEANVNRTAAAGQKALKELTAQVTSLGKSAGKTVDPLDKIREKVKEMDETMRMTNLTEIQKLEEEKQKWIDIYKSIGKATDAVEKYYDEQIKNIQKAQAKQTGQTYTSLVNTSVAANENNQRLGINSIESINILYDYLNNVEKSASDMEKSYLGKKLEIDVSTFFANILKNAKEQVSDNFNFKFEDLVLLTGEDINDYEQAYNEMIAKVLESVDKNGGLANEYEPYEDALRRIISQKQEALAKVITETASKGLPISEEDQNKLAGLEIQLNGLVNAYEALNKMLIQNDEFIKSKNTADYVTNGLFGTGKGKQNKNGFALFYTDDDWVKVLHKSLNNSAKVWADYGDAVTTVLDAVGDAWQNNINKELQEGKISQEQAEKEFKRVKTMQYSLAGINMAAGIIQCFSDPSLVTWYAKAAAAAAVTATGVAQMINIANTEMGGGSSAVAPQVIQPQIVERNPVNTVNSDTQSYIDAINDQKVYIVDTDIAQAGKKVQVREQNSTF